MGRETDLLSNSGEGCEKNFPFLVEIGSKPSCRTKLDVSELLFLCAHPCTPGFCSFRGSANPRTSESLKLRLPWLLCLSCRCVFVLRWDTGALEGLR